ncbi:hypothetical protein ABEP13_11540 [Geobacillus stearothermophilus]|uniref:Uncharacterized protein n=3 Tax=Geobacillus TaxID=129337 RepID=A0A0K9HGL5_GEOSE|nr:MULTISPECIES: hypothetical protein [Geobacillus]AEV18902.1 hypothetical protein GTCCBUS3UF5_15900 [Geobacillus thermoleovorans CCB_US3_UF5]GAD15200.1 hypothetical protein GBL_3417 [Geobacillus kaustophilus GBlys]GAJ59283.1 hypothetical protein B23_2507 [Geobacillus thermoleovorans B23]ATA59705.1 hypothetical protein GS458_1253 [Geobacillus stearothermophilus]KAF6511864.1 hypothetical protein GS8_833 [Geobacillus stearothermophilus]
MKWLKKTDATDWFFLMLYLSWLSEIDFDDMTFLRWITLGLGIVWIVIVVIKYKLKFEGDE